MYVYTWMCVCTYVRLYVEMCLFLATGVMYVSPFDIHCLLATLLINPESGYVAGRVDGGGFLHGGMLVSFTAKYLTIL